MKTERFSFPGAFGDQLSARLDRPEGPMRALALFAHCFTCSKDVFAASRISAALAEQGIATLRFDFTGLGHSDGEFANTNFSSNIADLLAAAAHLREHLQAPQILVGHSLGGAAVLAAAGDIPEVRAVATIGAPADPSHVVHNFGDALPEIAAKGEAEVTLAGRPFRIKQQFLEDVAAQRLHDRVATLRKPLLIFHAPLDQVVGVDNAAALFKAAKHPKSFVSLDRADHLVSRRQDAVYVGTVLAAWAEGYLDPLPEHDLTAGEGEVVVGESGDGKFAQFIAAGSHALRADEPEASGGDNRGPSPYDFLLAGLGACTSMTLRLYAEHKGLPLERTRVRLRHEKIHAKDCSDCESKGGKIDHIDREIEVIGPLDETQRQRLLEIADRCPVHRTLHGEVSVVSRLKESGSANT